MLTETLSIEFAKQLEFAEANAWLDQWQAYPNEFFQKYRFGKEQFGEVVVLTSPVIQFPLFNRVMVLGLTKPATEKELDDILAIFRSLEIPRLELHVIPHTQPPQLKNWLAARGLNILNAWDRIYRVSETLADKTAMPANMHVEKVTTTTMEEWATFLVTMYNLSPTKPLLMSLVERRGWQHYALRESGRIVAARSMYIHNDGMAWWGIEAPVPGLMTQDFSFDYHLCRVMVKDGLRLGAKYFVADIEKPRDKMDHDGYRHFAEMGFKRAYLRSNYSY